MRVFRRRSRCSSPGRCTGSNGYKLVVTKHAEKMRSTVQHKSSDAAAIAHLEVMRLMREGDWLRADQACGSLTAFFPQFAAGWFAASRIALARAAGAAALETIDRALQLDSANPEFLLHRARCLLTTGRRQEALATADRAARSAPANPDTWDSVGSVYSYANDQRGALAAYERAVNLAPESPVFRYNRASIRRFLGDLEGSESDYDRVIASNASDYEAYLNRSELRTQSAACNHVGELESLVARPIADWRGEVQIRFALAKEFEDLGDYSQSFEHLQRGATQRRSHMKYDVANDVATVEWIINAFPHGPTEQDAKDTATSPIFIVGLPRSGTTLAERILGSHTGVSSAGEMDAFANALVDAAQRKAGREKLPRQELVACSATVDFLLLGQDYIRRVYASWGGAGRFIDKMPLNYLYCGLIRRALPGAKIIHMTRNPMAVGYAMYKTPFKNGYPFSYDLDEIGRYYVAYRRLMDHWRSTMPGAIYELNYESLVANQIDETRKLLAHCGLEWQDACAEFHQNPAASMTASASQIRRPIYQSSVEQWRHFSSHLAPLAEVLRSSGIEVESVS